MDDSIRAHVLNLLEHYTSTTQQIKALQYELEHTTASVNEIIDAMNYGHGENVGGGGHQKGLSNKTMLIALTCQDEVNKANEIIRKEIMERLNPLLRERERLDYYISSLEEPHTTVIRMRYIEHKTWEDIASAINATVRTTQNMRKRAVTEICRMYAYAAGAR